jgi:hypothetical protein
MSAASLSAARNPPRARIGFLFNHDQIHQVAHSLPIAQALARGGYDGDIVVATTNDRLADEVRRLAGPMLGKRIEHVQLSLARGSSRLARLLGGMIPAGRALIYRDNLPFFRSFDALVVAEKGSLILRKVHGLRRPLLIHTRHGAGDRAIGFDHHSADFDLVLCSGPKIRERLIRDAGVTADKIRMVGYPKFDIAQPVPPPLATPPGRQVVLYNPHVSPHLSSWYKHGKAVLDFFVDNHDFQLIFAPHVMLFERRVVLTVDRLRIHWPGKLSRRHLQSSSIYVDTGSPACTDMTYTTAADIYLGDVSSQVYEFLYRPRPCLFLNSHQVNWRNDANYEHWQAGPVITHPRELAAGLQAALDSHATTYRAVQEQLCARSFDIQDTPASERAAAAIQEFVEQQRHQLGTAARAS